VGNIQYSQKSHCQKISQNIFFERKRYFTKYHEWQYYFQLNEWYYYYYYYFLGL